MSKTITGNTAYRKQYATQCIVRGSTDTRAFSNCFEMGDGDEVVKHIMHRALHCEARELTIASEPVSLYSPRFKEHRKARKTKALRQNLKRLGFWNNWLETYEQLTKD